jgi:Flp pilus assembly protein TadG
MKTKPIIVRLKDQKGATAVIVAVSMFAMVGMAALAIDLSHLYVVKNELQNAADAGALAGARVLYNDEGTSVNTGANQAARQAAVANTSENTAVEVLWTGDNLGDDVQRGHWQFSTRTFTPNSSTAPVDLWNQSTEELDANTDFINAVRVTARRNDTPAASFFARIFGYDSFQMQATAVAYIGFAGTLTPMDVDQPIAICKESITNDAGEYDCSIGRMINSGQDTATNETGGWTSFSQDDPCTGGTNAQQVSSLICAGGNPDMIRLNQAMATNGGEIQSAFNHLIDCWNSESNGRTRSWNLTLPVVTCPGNNVGTCEEVVGAVNVDIVWITGAGEDPGYNNAPTQMDGWSNSSADGSVRWNDFVAFFGLQNQDGTPAPYAKKSIYFKPSCTAHEPGGVSGGENFGILAEIPVLVK